MDPANLLLSGNLPKFTVSDAFTLVALVALLILSAFFSSGARTDEGCRQRSGRRT